MRKKSGGYHLKKNECDEQVKQLKITIMRNKFDLFQRFREMSLILKLLNLFHK
jgi:hypothetical protein